MTAPTKAEPDTRLGYSVPKFSEAFDISESLTWKLLRQGKIKSLKLLNRRIIPASEGRRLLDLAA